MEEYKCSKEKEIDKLTSAIYGNGKKGLLTITQGLSDQIGYITKTTNSIKDDLKTLLLFQNEVETRAEERLLYEEKLGEYKTKHSANKKWRIGLVITTILSITGLIIKLFA